MLPRAKYGHFSPMFVRFVGGVTGSDAQTWHLLRHDRRGVRLFARRKTDPVRWGGRGSFPTFSPWTEPERVRVIVLLVTEKFFVQPTLHIHPPFRSRSINQMKSRTHTPPVTSTAADAERGARDVRRTRPGTVFGSLQIHNVLTLQTH